MTLPTEKRTLLTVITEATIEQALLREFDRLGVRGYTVWDARGRGNRGMRDGSWTESVNIRIEMVRPRSQAEAVRPYLAAGYRLVAAGMDSLYLRDTCAGLVSELRNLPKAPA